MAGTLTKSADRRKAPRQAPALRLCWRLLGNRDLRYGSAALKDIGTHGLALQVDRLCPKGTVVIVQFAGAAEPFAEPMLLRSEWSEPQPAKDKGPAYLMGCSFTSPLVEKDLQALLAAAQSAAAAPAPPQQASAPARQDPFLVGSAGEKRAIARRGGVTVPVLLHRATGGAPARAAVVDRSLKGLGILIHRPFTRGTLLNVRPENAHEKTPSVQVEVRNCRQKGKMWLLGCHFLNPPPANVLMLLG